MGFDAEPFLLRQPHKGELQAAGEGGAAVGHPGLRATQGRRHGAWVFARREGAAAGDQGGESSHQVVDKNGRSSGVNPAEL